MVIYPVLRASFPLLTDYPNHLARIFIEDNLQQSPALARFYHLRSGIFPYLAMDAVVRPLTPWLGLERAGRVFVAFAILAPFLGTLALARVLHGRLGIFPITAALLCYNAAVGWGFLTFTVGVGLALAGLAAWIGSRQWRVPTRLLLMASIGLAIFFAHFFVFAMYFLLLASWEAPEALSELKQEHRISRGVLVLGLSAVPTVAVYPFTSRLAVGGIFTYWGTLANHLYMLVYPFVFTFSRRELLWYALPLLVGSAIVLARGRIDSRMRTPLLVFAWVSLVLPVTLAGVSYVHMRFPIMLAFMLAATMRVNLGTRGRAAFVGAVLLLLAARTVEVTTHLRTLSEEVASFRQSAKVIHPGSRILVAFKQASRGATQQIMSGDKDISSYQHLAALLIIDRAALYPLEFQMFEVGVNAPYRSSTTSRGLPILFHYLNDASEPPSGAPLTEMDYWRGWRKKFDYVVLFDFGANPAPVPPHLAQVASGSFFHIYKVS